MIEKTAAAAAEVAIEHSLNFFQAAASEKKETRTSKRNDPETLPLLFFFKNYIENFISGPRDKKGK